MKLFYRLYFIAIFASLEITANFKNVDSRKDIKLDSLSADDYFTHSHSQQIREESLEHRTKRKVEHDVSNKIEFESDLFAFLDPHYSLVPTNLYISQIKRALKNTTTDEIKKRLGEQAQDLSSDSKTNKEKNSSLLISIKFNQSEQKLARELTEYIHQNAQIIEVDENSHVCAIQIKNFDVDTTKSSFVKNLVEKLKKNATKMIDDLHKELHKGEEASQEAKSEKNQKYAASINFDVQEGEQPLEGETDFQNLEVLLALVAMARDMFEKVSPVCLQYIFLVRVMPNYKTTSDPPEPCKKDFSDYDWLNKLEVLAYLSLPPSLKEFLQPAFHERHNKWFHKGTPYQTEFATNLMEKLSVLYPYLDNIASIKDGMDKERTESGRETVGKTTIRKDSNHHGTFLFKPRIKRYTKPMVKSVLSVVRVGLFSAVALGTGGTALIVVTCLHSAIIVTQGVMAYLDYKETQKEEKEYSGSIDLELNFDRDVQLKARELAEFVEQNVEERKEVFRDKNNTMLLKMRDFDIKNRSLYVQKVVKKVRKEIRKLFKDDTKVKVFKSHESLTNHGLSKLKNAKSQKNTGSIRLKSSENLNGHNTPQNRELENLFVMMRVAAMGRDLFEQVNWACTQYILLVRMMPAYKALTNPLAHCEDDFAQYDFLNRIEAIAFYSLPEKLQSIFNDDFKKRHMKWFKDTHFQGTLGKEALKELSVLHPYNDNNYWLNVGIAGQKSLDADPFEHMHVVKKDVKEIVFEKVDKLESQKKGTIKSYKKVDAKPSVELTSLKTTKKSSDGSHRKRVKRNMSTAVQATFSGLSALTVIFDLERQYFPVLSELSTTIKISMCLYQVWAFGRAHVDEKRQLKRQKNDEDVIEVSVNFSQQNQELAQQLATYLQSHVTIIGGGTELNVSKNFGSDKSTDLIQEIIAKMNEKASKMYNDICKKKEMRCLSNSAVAKNEKNFKVLIVLMELVTMTRDFYEKVSPLCLQYILLVRAMPLYKEKAQPSHICKDDFEKYDWLNKVEAIAFTKLDLFFQNALLDGYKERHRQWFHKGTHYQGIFASFVMDELTVLHPYIDNPGSITDDKKEIKGTQMSELNSGSAVSLSQGNKHLQSVSRRSRRRKRGASALQAGILLTNGALFLGSLIPYAAIAKGVIPIMRFIVFGCQGTAFGLDLFNSKKKAKKAVTKKLNITFNHKIQEAARQLAEFVEDNVQENFVVEPETGSQKIVLEMRNFNTNNSGMYVKALMVHIREAASMVMITLQDIFYPEEKELRRIHRERVEEADKTFLKEMNVKEMEQDQIEEKKIREMEQKKQWFNFQLKFNQNRALLSKEEEIRNIKKTKEKVRESTKNQEKIDMNDFSSMKNLPDIKFRPTLTQLLQFRKLIILQRLAAIARDLLEQVSSHCREYILLVRILPAYRATVNPLVHCEEDFKHYDNLNRLEAIAYYSLPQELRTTIERDDFKERHKKWFNSSSQQQGSLSKKITEEISALHPYADNDYWLTYGMEGPMKIDADPHSHLFKKKIRTLEKNGFKHKQEDYIMAMATKADKEEKTYEKNHP